MSSADDVKSDPELSNAPAPAAAPAAAPAEAAPLPGAGAAAPAKNLREPQPTPLREAWKPKEGLVNLYWAPGSQPSRAVYQLMLEGNIPHRTVDINLRKRENRSDEFRYNINHHGLVPVIWDEGKFMPESVDILHYLSDKHNLDAWYPKDPAVRARVDEFLHWCPSHVRDITTGISRSIGLSKDAKLTAELKGRIPQMLNELEEKLANTNYIVTNEHPTIADLQLLHEVWGPADMGVVSFAQHPKGEAWLRRMKDRPHSKKAYGNFGKLMWALKTVLNVKWFFGSKTGTL